MKSLSHTFTLRVSECDASNTWRPGAILTELQETAGHHSAVIGCGREELLRIRAAWVVVRMHLEMFRYPVSGEKITVRTFHRPTRHRFFPRFFVITDEAGRTIGQASSLWLLMDLDTRQSMSADRLPTPLPDNSDMPEPMPLPGNVSPVEDAGQCLPCLPLYTDLDPNGHVNNTKYADWLCNTLGIETMSAFQLRSLLIHFNAEVRPGQQLSLLLRREENRVQLLGMHEDKAAFEIGALLQPRP